MTRLAALLLALTATTLNAQTFTISEEDPPAICPTGLVAASFLCTGDFCDDITFRCRSQSTTVAFSEWTPWVEHDGRARADCADPLAQGHNFTTTVMTGLACRGGNCDDVTVQCTAFPEFEADDSACVDIVHTDGDRAVTFPETAAIRAVACSGRHCDDMTITICPFTRR